MGETTEARLKKLKEYEEKAKAGESQQAIDRQHARGKLTARERIERLVDKDSFVELGMFVQHQCYDFGMEARRPLGDGVVTGYARINGRKVYLYAQDFTVMGATVGYTHAVKIRNIIDLALKSKAPVVGLIDTGGGRVQEGGGHYGLIFYGNIMASGIIPQISALMGSCAGGGVYSPALTDFILMVEGTSQMFITSPVVIKAVTGEEITMQDLGGSKPHSQLSGVCDFVAHNDDECLEMVKKLLGYLPSSYLKKPPRIDTGDPPSRCEESLATIVPSNPKTVLDMRNVVTLIVDNGEFFEVKANFAKNIITGFARLDGNSVGIVANQSLFLAGSLDCDASDKAARFYRVCDCFNIPIICFVDVPGYLPGVNEEYKGIIRHGAKMLYGFAEATVPKIVCVVRKLYGGSISAMGSKPMGADLVLAWPSAEIAVMGAEAAVEIIYRKQMEVAQDARAMKEQKIKEYREEFCTPYYAASKQMVDIVIDPRETRPHLIKALEMLQDKVEVREARKHGNIPL